MQQARTLLAAALELCDQHEPVTPAGDGADESAQAVIARLIHQAQHRTMVVHAVYDLWPPDEALAPVYQLKRELLARGGSVQLLVTQQAIANQDDLAALEEFAALGAQVRVHPAALPTLSIVDGSVGIVHTGQRGVNDRIVVVRDRHIVATIQELCAATWSEAVDLATLQKWDSAWRGDSTPLKVVALLGAGYTDDAAARKLGLSVRTYRRHVAEMMRVLGARSRFQAGILAAQRSYFSRDVGLEQPR